MTTKNLKKIAAEAQITRMDLDTGIINIHSLRNLLVKIEKLIEEPKIIITPKELIIAQMKNRIFNNTKPANKKR